MLLKELSVLPVGTVISRYGRHGIVYMKTCADMWQRIGEFDRRGGWCPLSRPVSGYTISDFESSFNRTNFEPIDPSLQQRLGFMYGCL